MTTKVYYIEDTNELTKALEEIENTFPCFVNIETIEMNYQMIEIEARDEDLASIEAILAPLM